MDEWSGMACMREITADIFMIIYEEEEKWLPSKD